MHSTIILYTLFLTGTIYVQLLTGQTARSTSGCSVTPCPARNRTNSSCSSSPSETCYSYTIQYTNQTFCAPSISCSMFEPCIDNAVCSSNTSICLSSTCCGNAICMPISLGVAMCNSTVPLILPLQCYNHVVNSDSTRNINYNQTTSTCDYSEFLVPKWVRFSGAAGTQLATSVPSMYRCGTYYPGVLNGTVPMTAGQTVSSSVCFYYYGSCYWTSTVLITNCGSYYVYYLSSPPTCDLRYCTV